MTTKHSQHPTVSHLGRAVRGLVTTRSRLAPPLDADWTLVTPASHPTSCLLVWQEGRRARLRMRASSPTSSQSYPSTTWTETTPGSTVRVTHLVLRHDPDPPFLRSKTTCDLGPIRSENQAPRIPRVATGNWGPAGSRQLSDGGSSELPHRDTLGPRRLMGLCLLPQGRFWEVMQS